MYRLINDKFGKYIQRERTILEVPEHRKRKNKIKIILICCGILFVNIIIFFCTPQVRKIFSLPMLSFLTIINTLIIGGILLIIYKYVMSDVKTR